MLSFAIAAPVFFFILFGAWELGLRTATVPAVWLNVQALIAGPQANSFYYGGDGIGFSYAGVEANLRRLVNLSADIAQASGFPNAVGAAAWGYRCDRPFETTTNPEFIASYKTENGLTIDLAQLEQEVKAACTERILALPDVQCGQSNPSSKFQLYVCYGVVVYLKTDPFSDPVHVPQISIVPPGGTCPPPTIPPTPASTPATPTPGSTPSTPTPGSTPSTPDSTPPGP